MANLKSSKERLQQVQNNLDPNEQEAQNKNQAMASLVQENTNSLKQLKQTLEQKEAIDKDSTESINGSLRSSIGYLTSISGKLSAIQTSVSSLKGTITSVNQNTDVTISLLGAIKTSLVQITGVLSAFRADFIMANNGVTINGDGYYDQGLLISDLGALSSYNNKSIRNAIKNIRDAAQFSDLMSNAVRPKVGNNKKASNKKGGLLERLTSKFLPEDMQDILAPITRMLPQAFGIDDSNIKNLVGSVGDKFIDPNFTKKYINPLNQSVTDILNGDAQGTGIFKQLLAGKLADATGLGDAETKQRETDPNLVMSSLAPFADDIKDMVKMKYEAISKRPNKIPIYATPVWVVNSSFQENGLEKKFGKELETQGKTFSKNRIQSAINGTLNNKKDENGNSLYSMSSQTGEMSGEIIDKFLEYEGQKDKTYDERFKFINAKLNEVLEEKNKSKNETKYVYKDAAGKLQQNTTRNTYGLLDSLDNLSETGDIIGRTLTGDITGLFELGGTLLNKEKRNKFFADTKEGVKGVKNSLKSIKSSLSESNDIENRSNYFIEILNGKVKDKLGDEGAEEFKNVMEVLVHNIDFSKPEYTESIEGKKNEIIGSINAVFPDENAEDIYNLIIESSEESKTATKKSMKQSRKEKKKEKKRGRSLFGHAAGREANTDIGEDTQEKEIRALAPEETVVPKKDSDKNKTMDDLAGASIVLASAAASIASIESQNVFYLGQAVNQGEIDPKNKKIGNPFNAIKKLVSKSSIFKKKIGGNVSSAVNELIGESQDVSKGIEGKEDELKHEQHLKMSDVWGKKEGEEESKEEPKEKEKTEVDKFKEDLKKKATEKLDLVKERMELAKRRLLKMPKVQKAKKIIDFIKDPTKKLREKLEEKQKEAKEKRDKKLVEMAKSGAKKLASGAKKVWNSKPMEKVKGFAKSIGSKFAKTKVGGAIVGKAKKAISFGKDLFKEETETEKAERLKTEAEKQRIAEEQKKKAEDNKKKLDDQDKLNEQQEKAAKENADADAKAADDLNKTELNNAKETSNIETKSTEATEKLKEKSEKNITKMEENSQKARDKIEDQATNQQTTMETVTASNAEVAKLQGASGEAESQASSSKLVAMAKSAAKVAIIGGTIASSISLIRSMASGKKSKGKNKDGGGGSSKGGDKGDKEAKKELKEAEKEAKKEEKKKEKERKKKERKEKLKRGLKSIVNKSILGIFTRTKVYIAENGDVIDNKTGQPVKKVVDGLETEEILNIKDPEGKKEFTKRLKNKEFNLVPNKKAIKKKIKKAVGAVVGLAKKGLKGAKNLAKKGLKLIGKGIGFLKDKLFGKKKEKRKVLFDSVGRVIDAKTGENIISEETGQYLTNVNKEEIERRKEDELEFVDEVKKEGTDEKSKKSSLLDKVKGVAKKGIGIVGKGIGIVGGVISGIKKIGSKIKAKQKAKMMKLLMLALAPALFMSEKMRKQMEKLQTSSLGQMMLNKPDLASNLLFNVSPASSALSLGSTAIKAGINLASLAQSSLDKLGGFFSDLFGKKYKITKGSLSQDLSSGTFDENATMALAQSRSRESSNRIVDSFMKSLNVGKNTKKSSNGDLYTTSKIVDEERKKKAIHVGVVGINGTVGTNTTSGGTSGGGGASTLSTSIPYSEYGIWKQSRNSSGAHKLNKDHSGNCWSDKTAISIGNSDISSSGCSLCSTAMMLVHAGLINETEFNPGVFADDINTRQECAGGCGTDAPMKHMCEYKGDKTMQFVDRTDKFEGGSYDDLFNYVVESMKQGYFLLGHVTNHYVCIDYVDTVKRVIYIMDPGFAANCWYDENKPDSITSEDKGYTMKNGPSNKKIRGVVRYKSSSTSASVYVLDGKRNFDSLHETGNAPGATITVGGGSSTSVANARSLTISDMAKEPMAGSVGEWYINDFKKSGVSNAHISSPFYRNGSGEFHGGIDISGGNISGTDIHSIIGGQVIRAGTSNSMGNFVELLGSNNKYYRFMHMISSPSVSSGQQISAGTVLGRVGSTGNSSGPHLHLDIADINISQAGGVSSSLKDKIYDPNKFPAAGMGKKRIVDANAEPDNWDNERFYVKNDKRKMLFGGSHIYQRDYSDIPYNTSGDKQKQTLGDSGCGPAAAATIKDIYKSRSNSIYRYGKGENDDTSVENTNNTTNENTSSDATPSTSQKVATVGESVTVVDEKFNHSYSLTLAQYHIDTFNALKAAGLTDAAACGALGNFLSELGNVDWVKQCGKGSTGYGGGMMAWTPYSKHTNWCASNGYSGQDTTLEANIAHAVYALQHEGNWKNPKNASPSLESQGYHPVSSFQEFAALTSVEDAAVNYERMYEVSYNWNGITSENAHKLADWEMYDRPRVYQAICFYNLLCGTYKGGVTGSTANVSGDSSLTSGNLSLVGWVDLVADNFVSGDAIKNYVNVGENNIWDKYNREIANSKSSASSDIDNTPSNTSFEDGTSVCGSHGTTLSNNTPSNVTPSPSPSTDNTPSNVTPSTPSNNTPSNVIPSPSPSTDNTPSNVTPSPSPSTDNIPSESILTKSGNSIVVKSKGSNTIVICNNFSDKTKANLEDIISNFEHLNNTQGKALNVLKAISDLIKDESGAAVPNLHLNNDGLDLLLKGI